MNKTDRMQKAEEKIGLGFYMREFRKEMAAQQVTVTALEVERLGGAIWSNLSGIERKVFVHAAALSKAKQPTRKVLVAKRHVSDRKCKKTQACSGHANDRYFRQRIEDRGSDRDDRESDSGERSGFECFRRGFAKEMISQGVKHTADGLEVTDGLIWDNMTAEERAMFIPKTNSKAQQPTRKVLVAKRRKMTHACPRYANVVDYRQRIEDGGSDRDDENRTGAGDRGHRKYLLAPGGTKRSSPWDSELFSNIYNTTPQQTTGLRPIIIDGSNVAMSHGNRQFSSKGLEICIKYFVKKGHKVYAFVPLYRRGSRKTLDSHILDRLEQQKTLIFTPSRSIDGQSATPYDDRFIVQCAAEKGGVIVSKDNYRDLLAENPAYADTVKNRLLMYTWVEDMLMFPEDPLGRNGPSLEEMLRF